MPVHLDKFIEALAVLADNRGMQLTMKQSGKGALLCGGMTLLGGLLGGRVGMAIGGTVGGITAYNMSPEFHPVGRIIQHHLTADEKQLLMDRIRASVRGTTPLDIGALIFALQNNAMIADLMLQTVKEFLVQAKGYME